MTMTYAVLHVPDFRLQATLRHSPQWADDPLALLVVRDAKPFVGELNAAAQRYRIDAGMTPTQALARCPDLRLLQANPGHERSAQDALIQTGERLSPFLESTRPGVVTVELPAERAFDQDDLVDKVIAPLQAVGLRTQAGIAATPDLALLAAQFGQPVRIVSDAPTFLAPLPLAALEPTADLAALLHTWGIRTIGQWTALPRAQACERLGPEAVALWERATGGRPRPLRLIKPPEFFVEQTDLEHPLEMLEPLLFVLRRFLEQIATRLGNAYLVAGKLRLVLRFENGAPYRRVFTIPQPTREVNLLFRLLHTHLENFTSESPIVALELAAKPVRPQAEQRGLLEKGLRDPHQFAETVGRLQALLGADRVGTPELEASHHPHAFHLRPYATPTEPEPEAEDLLIGVPWLRFQPPVPARIVLNELRPAFVYSARCTASVRRARGPWMLEGNWWEPGGWAREEWDVETDEGVYRLVRIKGEWFLDGIYA
jgi:protein ImuB